MKRLLVIMFCFLIGGVAAWAALPGSGTWTTQKITSNQTVTLTGEVKISGTIYIESGATLTIKRGNVDVQTRIGIADDFEFNSTKPEDRCLFYVKQGGKLVIDASSGSKMIYIKCSRGVILPKPFSNGQCIVGTSEWNEAWDAMLASVGGKINSATRNHPKYADASDLQKPNDVVDWGESGPIRVIGSLVMKNVSLYDAYSSKAAGAIYRPIQNASKYEYGSVVLDGCNLTQCVSQSGAIMIIYNQSDVTNHNPKNTTTSCKTTITNCDVHLNTSYNANVGGAIRSGGGVIGDLEFTSSNLYQNFSYASGGAIYWNAHGIGDQIPTMSFDGCELHDNYARWNGGALALEGPCKFINNPTEIYNNKADCDNQPYDEDGTDNYGVGGGIYTGVYGSQGVSATASLSTILSKYVKLYKNSAFDGGGIAFSYKDATSLSAGSSIEGKIEGAEIYRNQATQNGGGVYLYANNSTLNITMSMDSGDVHDNTAGNLGGGIYVCRGPLHNKDKCNVYFNGGSIQKNTSSKSGGGIAVQGMNVQCAENATGVTVSENTASDSDGGGIYLDSKSVFNMNSGTVSNNKAPKGSGAGVYLKESVLNIDGGSVISNTSLKSGGGISANASTITLSNGKVNKNNSGTSHGAGLYLTNCVATFTGGEIAENKTVRGVDENGGDVGGTGFGGGVYVHGEKDKNASLEIAGCDIRENSAYSGGGILVNGGTFLMSGGYVRNNNCKYLGAGICVLAEESFVIDGGEISGNISNGNGGAVHFTVEGGLMEVQGGMIKNNKIQDSATGNGGGIHMAQGSLNIDGGEISGNTATKYGGAIYMKSPSGCLTINKGNILNNTATGHGGAIFINEGANQTVEITGGIFSENKTLSADGNGGAINFNSEGGAITIEGGEFTFNSSARSGGAIHVAAGDLLVDGGIFSENTASVNGAALNMTSIGGEMTINAGEIKGNTSGQEGGGIFMNQGTLLINGGLVENNTSGMSGGGIYFGNSSTTGTVTMNNGSIKGNTANYNGGGINMSYGKLDINGGEISENTAVRNGAGSGMGGGLYVGTSADVTVFGGKIQSNKAYSGAGVFVSKGNIALQSGVDNDGNRTLAQIINNSADNMGGAIYVEYVASQVSIADGLISTNSAAVCGGGVAVNMSDYTTSSLNVITITGGSIEGNTCLTGRGGGVACEGGAIQITGGDIVNNVARIGGGIHIGLANNQAKVIFGDGVIRDNHAVYDGKGTFNTANGVREALLSGVGGGVFVDQNGILSFIEGSRIGLYNNIADKLGDDIFAGGVNTEVTLPYVGGMDLAGYKSKTSELYWVEDYMTGDTMYTEGTNLAPSGYNALRYRDAVATQSTVYIVPVGNNGQTFTGKYLALSLGHEVIYITIVRSGLQKGENALYRIYRRDNKDTVSTEDDEWTRYSEVILFAPSDANAQNAASKSASKRVALYSGTWRIEEIGWAWSYSSENAVEHKVTGESSMLEKTFVFTGPKALPGDENYLVPANYYGEAAVTNDFGTGTVVKNISSSESNSSFETIVPVESSGW